ncbi:ATP-dependent helicase Lhr and Lhr-like helicase [Chitinophaga sp. CF118]|nr:ATP-dependent helicase Lhr and Lhr-like helicase [Chitinophaga sp. CF118]
MQSEDHLILASRTASGKTEAAFLPVLSRVDFNEPGVLVLYISPLIALINDQFFRVEELCGYLDVPVTKWHGEANRTLKENLIKNPHGVVLITPESIEAMLVNRAYVAKQLFSNLKFIVIDEIHAFLGSDRGTQLQSLLYRLQTLNKTHARIIGLSATIGDFNPAKQLIGSIESTTVLRDNTAKPIDSEFKYFKKESAAIPLDLLKDLYLNVCNNKVLIFPNSRGLAEEIAVKLLKISQKVNGHPYYFSHHSSVDKELREYIEQFAKTNKRFPFTIACTSTLELGIDIGSVDKVVQIDATYSIASLIQRIGRSGRRENETSNLSLYATNEWSLLQSIACMTLYQGGFVEPVTFIERPYDILLHQAMALVRQLSECTPDELVQSLSENGAFKNIKVGEIKEIVQYLTQTDLFELIGGKLIIGVEGEKVTNTKDFYSVFMTDPVYKVRSGDKPVGEIPLMSYQALVGQNIFLAARIWNIVDVDYRAKKITVIPAKDGERPLFDGLGADVHPKVREQMLKLLVNNEPMPYISEDAAEAIRQLKDEFKGFEITDLLVDRPLKVKHTEMNWYTFQGSKVNRSIVFLFRAAGIESQFNDLHSCFIFPIKNLHLIIECGIKIFDTIDNHLETEITTNPAAMDFSKYGSLLPLKYQILLLKEKQFDFCTAMDFLTNVQVVEKLHFP